MFVEDGVGEDTAVCFGARVEVRSERGGRVEWAEAKEGVELRRGLCAFEERGTMLRGLYARGVSEMLAETHRYFGARE